MIQINIGICEDCSQDCQILLNRLKGTANDLNLDLYIKTFSTGKEFSEKYSPDYDLIFLDMQLPDISGDNLADIIRQKDKYVYLVFISKYSNYISVGYKHEAKNYLIKPLMYHHIYDEMVRFLRHLPTLQRPYIWINNRSVTQKIYFSKLRFIETQERTIILHYENRLYHHNCSISCFMKELPEHIFFQCNQSYIVNLKYADHIVADGNRYNIHLTTGEVLPLSRDKKKDFLLQLQKAGEHIC